MKKLYYLFFYAGLCFNSIAQVNSPMDPSNSDDVLPPSPSVASFMQFVNIPVNIYTGIPEISIPLVDINSYKLRVPISLAYHGGGVKVEELSGPVGQGWSLNAGGVISRTKRGRPDEVPNYGFFDSSPDFADGYNGDFDAWLAGEFNQNSEIEELIGCNLYDLEPDIFSFYLPGVGSGKIYFNSEKEDFSIVPLERYKIECTRVSGHIQSWQITDKNGIEYFFEDAEWTSSSSTGGLTVSGPTSEQLYNSWPLTKIIDKKSSDTILFTYTTVNEKYDVRLSETKYIETYYFQSGDVQCKQNQTKPQYSECSTDSKKVSEIKSKRFRVKFFYNNSGRPDYRNRAGCLLDSISIYNSENQFRYKYAFSYDTIQSTNTTGCDIDYLNNNSYLRKRIFLSEIQKSTNSITEPPYLLSYIDPQNLPPRSSASQDYWGYYNGRENNIGGNYTLIPSFYYYSFEQKYYQGASRIPDFEYGKFGTLNSIEYPTGGVHNYVYESHTYGYIRDMALTEQQYTETEPKSTSYMGAQLSTSLFDFTLEFEQQIELSFLIPIDDEREAVCDGYYVIEDSQGVKLYSTKCEYTPFKVTLPKGDYSVKFILEPIHTFDAWYGFSLKVRVAYLIYDVNTVIQYAKEAGGLRVKRTEVYDPVNLNTYVTEYDYQCIDDSTRSSGSLAYEIPEFTHSYELRHTSCSGQYEVASNVSTSQIGSTQGNHVGYSEVKVYSGGKSSNKVFIDFGKWFNTGKNGVIIKNYTSPISHPDQQLSGYPQIIGGANNWQQGKLTSEKIYNKEGLILNLKTNTYNEFRYKDTYFIGNKLVFDLYKLDDLSLHQFSRRSYYIKPVFDHLSSTINKNYIYDSSGNLENTITQTINYSYNDPYNLNLTAKEILHNNNPKSKTTYSYNTLYSSLIMNDQQTIALNQLTENHNLSNIVEIQENQYVDPGEYKCINGTIFNYKKNTSDDRVFLVNKLTTKLEVPTSITRSSISNGSFLYDSSVYKEDISYEYDLEGRMISYTKVNDYENSILYDKYSHPKASISNSGYGESYFTSFEDGDLNGLVPIRDAHIQAGKAYAHTGNYCGVCEASDYNYFQKTLDLSSLDLNGTYTLSAFSKNIDYQTSGRARLLFKVVHSGGTSWPSKYYNNTGAWEYAELTIDLSMYSSITTVAVYVLNGSSSAIHGQVYFDDIRVYPTDAQMTNFTTEPIFGVTSQTDTNGNTTYYEYDSFGRLKKILDKDKNLIEAYEYNYANQ